jgi:hypothetical protein
VVSRDDRSPLERAELDALDRILAREAVGEEHLELAALVDSVRADAPRMDPAFAARLDERVEERLARRRPAAGRRPRLRRLALAGGGAVAAAVALTIVLASGVLNGAGGAASRTTPALPAQTSLRAPAAGASRHAPAFAGASATPAANGAPVAAPVHAGSRLVHRDSTLELAAPVGRIQRVANGVVADTERAGGVVASSYVDVRGAAGGASFSLSVPSTHLGALIAAVSSLASVRSLTQATNDVTGGYDRFERLLAHRRAEIAALRRRLPAATAAQAASLRRRIAILRRLVAADLAGAAALAARSATAQLHVGVAVAPAPAHHAAAAGGSPLDRAARTALHALEELLAVALVVLAIVVPVALCALALWWGAAALRQRARERAIRAA